MYIYILAGALSTPTNFFQKFFSIRKSCDSLIAGRKIPVTNFREEGEQVSVESKCPERFHHLSWNRRFIISAFLQEVGESNLEEGSRRRRSRAWPGGTGSSNNRVFAPRPLPVGNGSTLGRLLLVEFCENRSTSINNG